MVLERPSESETDAAVSVGSSEVLAGHGGRGGGRRTWVVVRNAERPQGVRTPRCQIHCPLNIFVGKLRGALGEVGMTREATQPTSYGLNPIGYPRVKGIGESW